jgi:hypothetical protein
MQEEAAKIRGSGKSPHTDGDGAQPPEPEEDAASDDGKDFFDYASEEGQPPGE